MKVKTKHIFLLLLYIGSLIAGLFLVNSADTGKSLVGIALLMNFANGFSCVAFYRRLRIHIAVKVLFFLISVPLIIYFYTLLASVKSEDYFYLTMPVFVNAIGVCALGMGRLVLCKEKTYIFINLAILPSSLLLSTIVGGFELIFMAMGIGFLVVAGLTVIWIAGENPYYSTETVHTRMTDDGHEMELISGDRYRDTHTGHEYIYSTSSGRFTRID